ncbi:MAG: hypothetical protein K1X82_04005 [Bacteroidia bacterium]|nr:hypothetical protein [Bacteroidia bacterium]
MKRFFSIVAIAAFAVASMASCKKCGHCEISGITGPSYCTKDSQTLYDAAKTSCTANSGEWVTE